MSPACSRILDEMRVFADLGTDGAQGRQTKEGFEIRLFRNGDELALVVSDDGAGKVIERCRGMKPRTHASYTAVLASERFGDLRSWATTQARLLRETMAEIEPPIRVEGTLDGYSHTIAAEGLDDFLQSAALEAGSVQVLLIDGPAGIGKTKFIEALALARSSSYGRRRHPLVLHVQSRGRVLSYLQDLIAFSLQSLRLSVTFDQLPILVRHGLVHLAIDGFDELGDPDGHELAWAQLNETIKEIRGGGTLLLAGRETFFGTRRLQSALSALGPQDTVHGLTLQPPSPMAAEKWLVRRGWSKDDVRSTGELLDEDSYALRPFFLAKLAETDTQTLRRSDGADLLSTLINLMVERESGKFGDAVEAVLSADELRRYTHRFLCEAAQYMADDQSDIISEMALTWLVDMALPKDVDPDVAGLLKNRAGTVAFLANDSLPGYRRFAHSQLLNYFLSVAVIESAANGEVPKFVRRNIFSADFLAVFVEVLRHTAEEDPSRVVEFVDRAREWVRNYQSIDRGGRNLGAWIIAALPTMKDILDGAAVPPIGPMEVDETLLRGTAPDVVLRRVFVSQVDIRGADLRGLEFEESVLATVIVDAGTRVSCSFPTPKQLREMGMGGGRGWETWDPDEINGWLCAHTEGAPDDREEQSETHAAMLRVLGRACRSNFWIPESAETKAHGFVRDRFWPVVLDVLERHDYVWRETKGVVGRRSSLVHIKHRERILANDQDDIEVKRFYDALAARAEAI